VVTPPAPDRPICTATLAPGRARTCGRPAAYLLDCRCPRDHNHGGTAAHCPAHTAEARAGAMYCGACADAGHDRQPVAVASVRSLPHPPGPAGPAPGAPPALGDWDLSW
jgi:hypothetical protein